MYYQIPPFRPFLEGHFSRQYFDSKQFGCLSCNTGICSIILSCLLFYGVLEEHVQWPNSFWKHGKCCLHISSSSFYIAVFLTTTRKFTCSLIVRIRAYSLSWSRMIIPENTVETLLFHLYISLFCGCHHPWGIYYKWLLEGCCIKTVPTSKLEASADILAGHLWSYKARTGVWLSNFFVSVNTFCWVSPHSHWFLQPKISLKGLVVSVKRRQELI